MSDVWQNQTADNVATALSRLRLNRHFPPWRAVAAQLRFMSQTSPTWDRASGLPSPDDWLRLATARELAPDQLAAWRIEPTDSPELQARVRAEQERLSKLCALPEIPRRAVRVRLRHQEDKLASYEVVVDRFEPQSLTFARYTIVLWDKPGRRVSTGELEIVADDQFGEALQSLSREDAAVTFSILQQQVVRVEEVVRGVLAPAWFRAPDGTPYGPQELSHIDARGPWLSACLERVSIDVPDAVVDDPLAQSIVFPAESQTHGMSRRRKWAAPVDEVKLLRQWLDKHGSRNLVYGYRRA